MPRRLLAAIAAALLLLLGTATGASAAPGDLTMTLPGGEQGDDRTPLIAGTGDPAYAVHVLVNGVEAAVVTPAGDGTWSYQVTTDLPQGEQAQFDAEVRDQFGGVLAQTVAYYYVFPPVGTATIITPTAGSIVGPGPEVVATVTGPVQDAQLLVDGQPNGDYVGVTSDGTHQFFAEALTGGPHTLQVVALDGFDREVTSPAVAVTVDATPPPPAIIDAPADGSTITDRTPTFSGHALPGATIVVRFDRSYEVICSTTAKADGTWACQPEGQGEQYFGSFEGKRQSIHVLVTNLDEVGNENASAAITLIVDYRPAAPGPTPTPPVPAAPHPVDPASALPGSAGAPELANTGPNTGPGLAAALLLIAIGLGLSAASRRLPQH